MDLKSMLKANQVFIMNNNKTSPKTSLRIALDVLKIYYKIDIYLYIDYLSYTNNINFLLQLLKEDKFVDNKDVRYRFINKIGCKIDNYDFNIIPHLSNKYLQEIIDNFIAYGIRDLSEEDITKDLKEIFNSFHKEESNGESDLNISYKENIESTMYRTSNYFNDDSFWKNALKNETTTNK